MCVCKMCNTTVPPPAVSLATGGHGAADQTSAELQQQEAHVRMSSCAAAHASSSSLIEGVVDKFSQCPVCFDYSMMPPLWTVCNDNRHVICNICFEKLKNDSDTQPPRCPQCRQTFVPSPMRNRTRLTQPALRGACEGHSRLMREKGRLERAFGEVCCEIIVRYASTRVYDVCYALLSYSNRTNTQ